MCAHKQALQTEVIGLKSYHDFPIMRPRGTVNGASTWDMWMWYTAEVLSWHVQIFTSSMFTIKKRRHYLILPFLPLLLPLSQVSFDPKSLLFSLYSSRNTTSEPYQRLMLWKYGLRMMANTFKTSAAGCPVLVNYLSTSTHCCLPRQMMCTRISWLKNIFSF